MKGLVVQTEVERKYSEAIYEMEERLHFIISGVKLINLGNKSLQDLATAEKEIGAFRSRFSSKYKKTLADMQKEIDECLQTLESTSTPHNHYKSGENA
jgi:hypothetical protein